MLYRVRLAISGIRTINFSDRHGSRLHLKEGHSFPQMLAVALLGNFSEDIILKRTDLLINDSNSMETKVDL